MLLSRYPLALLPLLSYAAPHPRAADPTVTIASGVVVGTATAVSNQPTATGLVNAYLGVPFAKSPPLRFAPPEAPKAWSSPLKAQTLPPACLQQFLPGDFGARENEYFNNPGLPKPRESEDCLYLNVFSPPDASPTNLKPVMYWIFGGNLQIGTASLAYYNGSSLAANHDVVVVAVNYRTNMFGFSNSPEIPFGKQNAGFLDQRFGLEWVQQNIKQFGGDPTKVTIFGESAGGNSVKQLLANPPNPLTFRAAIMESEQTAALGNGLVDYGVVAARFGCALTLSPLNCLREVPATDLQKFISDNALGFFPVAGDGTNDNGFTLPSILSGKFADVPILMGTNKNEFTVFASIFGLDGNLTVLTNTLKQAGIDLTPITNAILDTYAGDIVNDGESLVSQVATDAIFTCSTSALSTAIEKAGRQPIWRYRYDASFPNIDIFTSPTPGAYHSSEIPSVFGTYPLKNQYGDVTQTQIDLSKYMQTAWTNFAKNPTAGPGWPKLGSNGGNELGLLGSSYAPAGEHTVPLASADYPCPLYMPIIVAAGLAY